MGHTITIPGVELFMSGTHNGDPYTLDDLNAMIRASGEVGFTPPIKIGHMSDDDTGKLLKHEGLPAFGWIKNLRVQGQKLLGDLVEVPRRVADLIKAGAYRRLSAEIYWNFSQAGKTWPRVLKAVSLLGAEIPAVTSLRDIEALYTQKPIDGTGEVKLYYADMGGLMLDPLPEESDVTDDVATQMERADVLYRLADDMMERCGTCRFYIGPSEFGAVGACAAVTGEIAAAALCDLFEVRTAFDFGDKDDDGLEPGQDLADRLETEAAEAVLDSDSELYGMTDEEFAVVDSLSDEEREEFFTGLDNPDIETFAAPPDDGKKKAWATRKRGAWAGTGNRSTAAKRAWETRRGGSPASDDKGGGPGKSTPPRPKGVGQGQTATAWSSRRKPPIPPHTPIASGAKPRYPSQPQSYYNAMRGPKLDAWAKEAKAHLVSLEKEYDSKSDDMPVKERDWRMKEMRDLTAELKKSANAGATYEDHDTPVIEYEMSDVEFEKLDAMSDDEREAYFTHLPDDLTKSADLLTDEDIAAIAAAASTEKDYAAYSLDQCCADQQQAGYDEETAKKICGAIKAGTVQLAASASADGAHVALIEEAMTTDEKAALEAAQTQIKALEAKLAEYSQVQSENTSLRAQLDATSSRVALLEKESMDREDDVLLDGLVRNSQLTPAEKDTQKQALFSVRGIVRTYSENGAEKKESVRDILVNSLKARPKGSLLREMANGSGERTPANGGGSPADEVNARITEYRQKNPGVEYKLAYHAVLDADPDLKERYARG